MRKMPKTSLAIQKKKCCHHLRVTAILTELGYLKKVNTDKMQHSDKISFPRWAIFLWCYIVYTFLYNTNTSTFHVKSLCLKDKCCLGGKYEFQHMLLLTMHYKPGKSFCKTNLT